MNYIDIIICRLYTLYIEYIDIPIYVVVNLNNKHLPVIIILLFNLH